MNPQVPLPPPQQIDSDLADFPELWRTINRYKWKVLAVTALFALLGILMAFSEDRIYRATATVMVESRPDRVVQVQEVYDPGFGTREYYGTQGELVRAHDLVGRAVDRLDLTVNDEIIPPVLEPPFWRRPLAGNLQEWLPFLPDAEPVNRESLSPERRREMAINVVQKRVAISWAPGTQVMRVHVESRDPQLAATIANTLVELYVDSGLEARLEATERASRWLTEKLVDLRARLQGSEQALQSFRESKQLIDVGGVRRLNEDELVENSRKLRDAQRRKTELASTYWKIQQAGSNDALLDQISALLLDPLVQKASENRSQAQLAIKQLEERYGAKHPQMASAQARVEGATRAYHEQLRLAANGVKAEYEIAAETERALLAIVQSGKAEVRELDRQDYQLRALEREVQTNRDLYDLFLKRFKETDITSTQEPINARILDRAIVPTVPDKPDKSKIVLLWSIGGLVLGVLLSALRHLLSETVRSADQLEHTTQLPVLSVLPRASSLARKFVAPSLCVEQPRAPFSEGVRSIRASLFLSDVDKRMKRVMFTSALPQEGKSSLASGFAATLGQSEKVLLLEADLRAPTLKKMFKIGKEAPGLVEVLTGQAKLQQAIFHHAESGIDVLPVAQLPANPAEVISSAAFHKLIETVSATYDRIVFDTPPCHAASDSILLASRMDTVIFVIHAGKTPLRAIQTAIKHLRTAQAPLLGHVLNNVDPRTSYGYGLQYYGYGQYGR